MQIGIVGIGRMGRVLAVRLAEAAELTLYDVKLDQLAEVAAATGAKAGASLEEAVLGDAVILALPDREVIDCLKELNQIRHSPITVINVATNVAQSVLEHTAAPHVRCISAKFIGQAGEMAAGARPVIVVHEKPEELVALTVEIFSHVGDVLTGNSDVVTTINTIAAEKAIEAAVLIEESLRMKGFSNPAIAKSAIGQVAAGIVKAYAADNLGPFAREIVHSVKKKLHPGR
jgi:pyrroline-5-carboxylate reductase